MPDGSCIKQFTFPQKLDERLLNISEETGLSQAEIVRRGALKEINQLEGER